MSLRNKKLVALESITHSLQKSVQKQIKPSSYLSTQKKQTVSVEKPTRNTYIKRFQVRKIPQLDTDSSEKKVRFKSLRMYTEKLTNSPLKKRPLLLERSHTEAVRERQSEQKYPFLTKFQREQIVRYEVFFIGSRRIQSEKDFTHASCLAKVLIGDSIAYRYEILSVLGQGSFGQVFKAYDYKREQMVALKIIRNEPKFNRQAKVEIKILENVLMNDPKFKSNIVQLKHAFFFRGHACLSFELLHINLYQFLKKTKFNGLNLDIIRRISIQILKGLLFLKKQNIIHCDLKPQNVLLKQQNKTGVKIIDVGSGCFQNQQIYTYIQSRFYRAPEIILGITYTPAIDIWSLGCILCELLLGFPIFPGESQFQQLQMTIQVIGQPPQQFIKKGSRANKFFEGNLLRLKQNNKGKNYRPNSKPLEQVLARSQDSQFISFVKRFLVWDPQQRITAYEALNDPWILKGLPEEIRKQHILNLKKQSMLDPN